MESGLTPVLFDLDGTLIDSAPDLHAAASTLLAELGHEPLPLPVIRGFVGQGVAQLVERSLRAVGEQPDADRVATASARFLDHYGAAPARLSRPYPGVLTCLKAFLQDGRPMAVCTNKPEGVSRVILEALGMGPALPVVVGGDSCATRKPDPEPARRALALLDQTTAIFVGDSETDAETARRAGLPFLLHTEGYRDSEPMEIPHDGAFADFSVLPELVARHAPANG